MTIEKITELLTLYGNLQFNAGSYSQLSCSACRSYGDQAIQAQAKLVEEIIKYGRECAKKEHVI